MQIPGYRIVRKINQGGMSTVYLAIQLSVGREVALKVMSPALNADPVFSQRFQREANIVGQLSHPNIVSIYDIGCYKNLNYIAMDYLPGGTVHDRMKTGLSVQEILRITKEVARALDLAHAKGYVHRDIKPENILFREDGAAVLSDFGVAKALTGSTQTTNAGLVVGTPHYMSPEQSRGLAIDGRSDIYSLGIVFYEMLTGTVPYQADEAVAIAIKHVTAPIPTLPAQHALFQPLLSKFIAKKADDRFQRGNEIVEAIDALEETMAGKPSRRRSLTDPVDMNVMALLKALLLTTYAVLMSKTKAALSNLLGWRWTPKRGFYHHPRTKVTEIHTDADKDEDQRVTVISTRIRKAAHYQELKSRKLSYVTRAFMFLFVCSIIWSAVAVGLRRFGIARQDNMPAPLFDAISSTAQVIEGYAAYLTGNNADDATATTAADENQQTVKTIETLTERRAAEESVNASVASADVPEPTNEIANEIITPAPKRPTIPAVTIKHYGLTVHPTPQDATVRILNIRERYQPNIQLEPGRYRIEVARDGFRTKTEWVTLADNNLVLDYTLAPIYRAGDSIVHTLKDLSNAPEMVIIAKGSFVMGDKAEQRTGPERDVTINHYFAVSKYEVTFADYDKFARDTGAPLPNDKKWGRGSRPVINVSWYDANQYAAWLSEQTGNYYRLPTEAEWEYVARAGTTGTYWWGNGDAARRANCKRGCDSEYTGVFSSKTAPVGSFAANPFGLYDTSGNVAEWVADCYQNHYIGAPTDGSAFEKNKCEARTVRGGSMQDSAAEITSTARTSAAAVAREDNIGIRLVLELE